MAKVAGSFHDQTLHVLALLMNSDDQKKKRLLPTHLAEQRSFLPRPADANCCPPPLLLGKEAQQAPDFVAAVVAGSTWTPGILQLQVWERPPCSSPVQAAIQFTLVPVQFSSLLIHSLTVHTAAPVAGKPSRARQLITPSLSLSFVFCGGSLHLLHYPSIRSSSSWLSATS